MNPFDLSTLLLAMQLSKFLTDIFPDLDNISNEAQRLETILWQLDKPITRSATQLSDLHDSLKSE
jgi:hypothetical protein